MVYSSDSDSSEDFSIGRGSSTRPTIARKKKTPCAAPTHSVVIPDTDVTQGSTEDRFAAIMALKAGLGMDQDPDFLRQEEKKAALKKQQEEEQKQLEGMTAEERLQHEQSGVMDMMSKIRAKREQQMKEGIHQENEVDPEKEKKAAKKAKKLEAEAKHRAYEERREARRRAAATAAA